MLSEFYEKTPDLVSEEELQEYFLHKKNVNKWAPNTMRICYCGIRFFFEHVLKRDWHILNLIRAQNERRLPAVLSTEEVRSILNCINTFHNYAFLTTVYSCGLRLQEAMYLEVSDIMPKIKEKVLKVTKKWRKTTKNCSKDSICRIKHVPCSEFKPPTFHQKLNSQRNPEAIPL